MLAAVLSLALALQQVQIKVERRSDTSAADSTRVAADSTRNTSLRGNSRRRPPRRAPVTPELERTAFRDPGARELLLKARSARLVQDSSLLSYDASAYQRVSVGLGVRAIGRDRLLFRMENASRVRWSRANGLHIDVKGARTAIPMIKEAEKDANITIDDFGPVPYFPGRDALWIGTNNGVAKAEVNEDEMVHPIATGAEAYYRYSSGDSVSFKLSDGRAISLRELRVEPRRPEWKLSVGSFWFDASSGQLVRAAYRFAAEMDIWKVASEDENDPDPPPGWVKAMISPLRANLEAVTIEYGLYGGRFWLPRSQVAEASARASFMRIPVTIQESFKYADVNGVDSLPPVPPAPRSLRDSLYGDSAKARDLTPEERKARARRIAAADSVRREAEKAKRAEECASAGSYVRYQNRYENTVRVAVRVPCDSTVLAHSPELPPSIYDPGEELFGAQDRDELLKALDFSLQPGWAPQRPTLDYGLDLVRYNRVEGLSAAVRARQELGRGYSATALARLGVADWQPNGELAVARDNGRRAVRVGLFRRLAAANDWGSPLSFGSGLSAFLFGRDEGFYYRTRGGELAGSNLRGGGLSWRLFAEHQTPARRETDFSLAKAVSGTRFIDNITATSGTVGGGELRFAGSLGLDPQGWRLLTDARVEGAAGSFDYTRGALDLTLSRGIGSSLAAALTGSAGTSGGALPPQRLWYLGGTQTVRGQPPSLTTPGAVGNSYWLGRLELGSSATAVRPVVFGDIGWAGDRASWSHTGRPLSGAGVGASFLDGIVRFDVARGIYPEKKVRVDLYMEARF